MTEEWVKKKDVLEIIKGLPSDLHEEYIYMLKGVWFDEDDERGDNSEID